MKGPIYFYGSTKTYTHAQGLSCAFRQWRAKSHCAFIHGYALQVTLDFYSWEPDDKGWVVDFGGLKPIKEWLEDTFDHKLLVAADDPMASELGELRFKQLADVRMVPGTGCENFAKLIANHVEEFLTAEGKWHVKLRKVTVAEHGGNSAYVERKVT